MKERRSVILFSMRLEKIKLAGFKSFVDPTTVNFPSNLVGIVGPNGCGKSNVIDAVRWVMGESSAKMLRGDSMADVIFNGSNSRKPVGAANIELVFDNSDGSSGGNYAQYAEISVKRQVMRDGQSLYFLNNVRCRRKDVTDLFLGTGLGPRSYSIIEQGMISKIIEARPEDLRIYLEEAAGISKYKERRRETENRIRHTRENLERLDDLREEVQKQLRHLERQASAAENYKIMRQEERQHKAELITLKLTSMEANISEYDKKVATQEISIEAAVSEQRNCEREIEEKRSAHLDLSENFNIVQGGVYKTGSEIARLEESIQFSIDKETQLEADLSQVHKSLEETKSLSEQDETELERLAKELDYSVPKLDKIKQEESEAIAQQNEAEKLINDWQNIWDDLRNRTNNLMQDAQVERTRINHLERQIQEINTRITDNKRELSRLTELELSQEIKKLQDYEIDSSKKIDSLKNEIKEFRSNIEREKVKIEIEQKELDSNRSELQISQGKLSSLRALQEKVRGNDDNLFIQWIKDNNLTTENRLLDVIEVAPEWQFAVEAFLNSQLQAIATRNIKQYKDSESISRAGVQIFELDGNEADVKKTTLASVVKGPHGLINKLNSVFLIEDIPSALNQLDDLSIGESFITRQGISIGPGWVCALKNSTENGAIAREGEIRNLLESVEKLKASVKSQTETLNKSHEILADQETKIGIKQKELEKTNANLSRLQASLSGKEAQASQINEQILNLENDRNNLTAQLNNLDLEKKESNENLNEALKGIEDLNLKKEKIDGEKESIKDQVEHARNRSFEARNNSYKVAIELETMKSSKDSLTSGMSRIKSQLRQLEEKSSQLETSLNELEPSLLEQKKELEKKLIFRIEMDEKLVIARKELEKIDEELRNSEQSRHVHEENVQKERNSMNELRMARQELVVLGGTLKEQLSDLGFEYQSLYNKMPQDADVESWQKKLDQIAKRIERLGPINLAAIDEFKDQKERMDYLDSQHEDVEKSLETLETAIRKIDKETRTKFKETFDKVDAGFKELFPKLFGGGHAYLELTGEDLLDTGVSVMARPPGKRNSSIQLLSGGEKALTAVAMVFSIFQLNPAPFCMLDEVDAPLDDANVARYCKLVQEMSQKVQFIFITHNKVTMQVANQLSGVTMQEPGVSRLVSVDVEEAAAMAAV